METVTAGNLNAVWLLIRWRMLRWTGWMMRCLGWRTIALSLIAIGALAAGLTTFGLARAASLQQAELKRQQALPAGVRPEVAAEDSEVLANYYASLTETERVPTVLGELLLLAHQQHVSLGAGEYRVQSGARQHSSAYRIRFPIAGDAAAVQAFVIAALNAHPSLALDAFSMRREAAATGRVEASVQFVLLVADSAAGPAT